MIEPKYPRGFLPFLPRFGPAILNGEKTATTRRRRHGIPGDALLTPYGPVVLTGVIEMRLGTVAEKWYREEGLASPAQFADAWNACYPEELYREDKTGYLHVFRLAGPGEVRGGVTHL